MVEEKDVMVPMRDGLKMALRIYRPDGAGPFPALFATSPYRYDNNELPCTPTFLWRETGPIDWYVNEQGYAYVHADVRGSGVSEGNFGFHSKEEQHDLYEMIEWIARQPWSNGKVGGIGQSYYCISQWFMGIEGPPHLACIAPYDGMVDPYRHMAYPGGIEGNFLPYWYNSSVRVPNLFPANGNKPRKLPHDLVWDAFEHPFCDEFWKERSAVEKLEKIKTPLFSFGVWAKLDLHCSGNIVGYLRSQGPKKLGVSGTPTPFSAQHEFSTIEFHKKNLLPFYDKYLKGEKTSFDQRPNVQYAVHNTGQIRSFDQWPPPGLESRSFYLAKGPSGSVQSLNDGGLSASPAQGGSTIFSYPQEIWSMGVVHIGRQGPDPARGVLTFTTQPLASDVEIAGSGRLIVFASSTRNDMDFIVKVSEQFPQTDQERASGANPRYRIVTKGYLRASHSMDRDERLSIADMLYYRHDQARPIAPGHVYQLEIPLLPMAYRFQKGNRIRIEVANGDSPVTDLLFTHLYRPDKHGQDTIYHDAEHPSRLVLPVLKAD
ncbi:MAG TPA: CocE/NonD family hydrolase [Patescibacteria group bacterium]|nr:CocE/NonD family hydrolase [Patescibacteria group bacterium]